METSGKLTPATAREATQEGTRQGPTEAARRTVRGVERVAAATRPVLPLSDPEAQDPGVAGRKAATLARLAAAGFPVPEGWLVTSGALMALEDGGRLPSGVREALAELLSALGDAALAVRSSALAEDRADASYAGQYDTVLGVRGLAALEEAVLRCRASAFSARVAAYREREGGGSPAADPEMAVLVQRLVEAEAAGVAFTADPVTGEREVVRVSAVRGLGDRLVGGEATGDEWIVRGGEAECLASPEGALDAARVLGVAELARRVEAGEGVPQDLEWAYAGGRIHLLQARPITALPVAPTFEIPSPGTWLKDRTHYPAPITPLGASIYLSALDLGMARMCEEFGLLLEGMESRSLGGEVYGRPIPVGGKDGPAPPPWLMWVLVRLLPPLLRRLRAARQAVTSGLLETLPRRWHQEWRAEFETEAAALRGVDLWRLSDSELEEHLERTIGFLERGQLVHFRLFIPYLLGLYQLAQACRELLGWDTPRAMELLAGLSEASSEPARALASLAAEVRRDPAARAAVAAAGADTLERLRQASPSVAAAALAYLERFGHRVLGYDPGVPTLAEDQALFARLLRDAVETSRGDGGAVVEGIRSAARERARAALPPGPGRDRFEAALVTAEAVYPLREENVLLTDSVPNALIRYAALEMGRRLAQRGVLARSEDAVWLESGELRAALHAGESAEDLRPLVSRRRAERAWVAAHPGPAYYGPAPAPPPDMSVLPPEARLLNGAIMWAMSLEFDVSEAEPPAGTLRGTPGSPGRYTGTVRLIRDETEFRRLRPGEVLVCTVTTPSWSVLFGTAGAVVTDGGSPLAHTAIVAREHGIPAVVATRAATGTLREGTTVTVDGTAGVVELQQAAASGAP